MQLLLSEEETIEYKKYLEHKEMYDNGVKELEEKYKKEVKNLINRYSRMENNYDYMYRFITVWLGYDVYKTAVGHFPNAKKGSVIPHPAFKTLRDLPNSIKLQGLYSLKSPELDPLNVRNRAIDMFEINTESLMCENEKTQ